MIPYLHHKKQLPATARIFIVLIFFSSCTYLFSLSDKPDTARLWITIASASEEFAQVFWQAEETGYADNRSSSQQLQKGEYRYEFSLVPSFNLQKVRIDPALRPATIEIVRLVIQWDDEKIFVSEGEDLAAALVAVRDADISFDRSRNRLAVISSGDDPILELAVSPSWNYRLTRLAGQAAKALLPTLIWGMFFCWLSSEGYSAYSYFTYPARTRQWLYWGAIFLSVGLLLVVVYPVKLIPSRLFFHTVSVAYCLGAAAFIPCFWLTTRSIRKNIAVETGTSTPWYWFALPSLCVWSFYLLSFWPASLSPDSLDQWRQVLNGNFKDWHPAFHTMNLWLLTRLYLSPAVVAIAQMLALSAVMAWVLGGLRKYGVSSWVLWGVALIFALWPVNGLMAITIWKDVAYSVALLLLTGCIFKTAMSDGSWLCSKRNLVILGISLLLVSLYRHNGLFPAVGTIVLMPVLFQRFWKQLILLGVIVLMIHGLIRGPVYTLLDVKRGNPVSEVVQTLYKDFISTEDAGHNKSDGSGSDKVVKAELIEKLGNDELPEKVGKTELPEKLDSKKSKSVTDKILNRVYSASRLWRITPMNFFHKRIGYVNLWSKWTGEQTKIRYINSNKHRLKEKPRILSGTLFLFKIFEKTCYHDYLFWMWRPAVYLYTLVAVVLIMSYRLRKKLYLLLLPVLLNALPIFLMVVHKSIFRYHYPIVAIALVFIIPLFFVRDDEP